jgi:hypothetical protein
LWVSVPRNEQRTQRTPVPLRLLANHRPRNPPGGSSHARINPDTGHRAQDKHKQVCSVLSAFSPASFVCANHCGSQIVNSRSFLQTATGQSPVQAQILVLDFGWVRLRKDLWRMLGISGRLRRKIASLCFALLCIRDAVSFCPPTNYSIPHSISGKQQKSRFPKVQKSQSRVFPPKSPKSRLSVDRPHKTLSPLSFSSDVVGWKTAGRRRWVSISVDFWPIVGVRCSFLRPIHKQSSTNRSTNRALFGC